MTTRKTVSAQRVRNAKHNIKDMEVGDSLLISDRHEGQVRPLLYYYNNRYAMVFEYETEGTGVRVWRVG